ncbi:transcriptional regulator NanR [Rhizobium sp. CF142]|uniref:transcriptional regulator NanR n=1 Tax=Rhizobium sp. CF142 TaxID=1144314 RepID=UPI00055A541C|nr:transcriptional regulator NanR [Rhizobium sp. CF142]
MTSSTDQIIRRKLSDEVLARLERMIATGELKPGDELPSEGLLMERFGVGRATIREAMRSLGKIGLVSISRGERAKVLQLTANSIFRQVDVTARVMLSQSAGALEHLKSARIFFERGMAREATSKTTVDDITDLKEILHHQRGALGDSGKFISADRQFHTRIAQISRNPLFVAVSEAMVSWVMAYHTDMLVWPEKERFTLVEHERILDRLAAKDEEGADAEMLKHLERSWSLYTW